VPSAAIGRSYSIVEMLFRRVDRKSVDATIDSVFESTSGKRIF
jgi:hypothetical protein